MSILQQKSARRKLAIEAGDFEAAWTALQRAHILGQAYPVAHALAYGRSQTFALWRL